MRRLGGALALVMRGAAREVVLVDRTRKRARAVATDLRYGAPLSPLVDIRDGDFNDLAGAALVMGTAGVNEKAGGQPQQSAGRLKLLDINRGIFESLVPRVVEATKRSTGSASGHCAELGAPRRVLSGRPMQGKALPVPDALFSRRPRSRPPDVDNVLLPPPSDSTAGR